MKGRNVFIESVKAEQNSESLEPSHCCVARYKSTGGGRPRQNLTEVENFFLQFSLFCSLFSTEAFLIRLRKKHEDYGEYWQIGSQLDKQFAEGR